MLAAVRVLPVGGGHGLRRVRGVGEDIIVARHATFDNLLNFATNRDHGLAESIQLGFGFTLGRLDHERSRNRKGHGGRMKAEVHEALGYILRFNPRRPFELAEVQDKLVGHEPFLTRVEHREILLQPLGHVIGVQDGDLAGFGQAFGPHQRNVGPGDRQDAGAPIGRGGNRPDRLLASHLFHHWMTWEERGEVSRHSNGPHAGTAASVRDTEGLMQVEMAHVGTEVAGPAQPDLRVHIGPIQIHLSAVSMGDRANPADAFLEHPVGRGIGDHQRSQRLPVLFRFRL